jgi:hypothetical protein
MKLAILFLLLALPRFCAKGPVLQGGDEERTDRRSVIRVRVVAQYIAEERR